MKNSYEIYIEILSEQQAPAERQAAVLIEQGRYEEAEQTVRAVDDSIYGTVAIARLYQKRLEQLVSKSELRRDRPRLLTVFRKAIRWAQSSYPEAHTQYEAADYDRSRAQDRADLVRIMGYDPGAEFASVA